MKNKIAAIFAALILVLQGCSFRGAVHQQNNLQILQENKSGYKKMLDCVHFNAGDFRTHTAKAAGFPLKTISAGIVPHHLLAGELIASFFKTVKDTGIPYETVIIIGPDHKGEGNGISIADCGFRTSFGDADYDEDVGRRILQCKPLSVNVNNELLQNDQAVSGIIPYAKYYLQDAKVVTLLLSRRVSLNQVENLANLINDISKSKKILVVGSVDFSHGLSPDEAAKKDKITLKEIKKSNLNKIKNMSNENLDSPETLCTLLYYMKECKEKEVTMLSHKSASDYLPGERLENCTTYFVLGCI
ncbi:MAG: AmmeMemoRadiSam system protein B [Clostridiales bacterium]|nr:AmmeMemoRadiSam system protein B [Clostridiales bacterium]